VVNLDHAWATLNGVPDPEVPVLSVVDLGIVRELAVAEDQARGRVQAGRRCRDEHGEGVVIAPPCPLDERLPVHGPWFLTLGPAQVSGSAGYGVGARGFVSRDCGSASGGRGRAGRRSPA